MSQALILTYDKYPEGDAGAIRDHAFAKIYQALGYKVVVLCMGKSTDFKFKTYDDVPYVSLRKNKNDIFSKVSNYLLFKIRVKKYLNQRCSIVHITDIPLSLLKFLKKYARKNNVKLVYDCVEWYSPEQFKLKYISFAYIIKNLYNTRVIDKNFIVISISTFLENHFTSRGIKTIRIPVIMDIKKIQAEKNDRKNIKYFLYAGSPGKKDYLFEIIKGFSLLSKEILNNIKIIILGVDEKQLISACGIEQNDVSYLGDSLKCMGRVSRQEVLDMLKEADFTVLLRSENQRYSKAGFPTKVVESLASATPIITNITSDLGLYLKNEFNSILVKDCSAKSFADAIEHATSVSQTMQDILNNNARITAEENFDFRAYIDEYREFINKD